jgi:uncharacterized membrane protein
MIDMGIAIGLHVFGVLWWVGGLTFVTLVVLPLLRSGAMGDVQAGFHKIESRFAPQVKMSLLLVGITGLYMLWRLNTWAWLLDPHKWWVPAMLVYWTWFFLMLFVLGPAGLLKKIMKGSGGNEAKAWKRLHTVHTVLMVLGWIIVFSALAGDHYGVMAFR